ncbi:MAG: 50S ribosomal protein L15 [Bdellovibrionales bacterium]|nr:50S ribosomal protein L15 [Bdellovibrionales bacterium]
MQLSNLKAPQGSRKGRKRLGRGESSGLGKTSGKGHKGQSARSGGGVKIGFEGGQMPLMRRLPKFGFTSQKKEKVQIINLRDLECFDDGQKVSIAELKEKKFVRPSFSGKVKVLATGKLSKKLSIEGFQVSAQAKQMIEKQGGTVVETLSAQAKG